jgi:hypothetical protein
MRKDPIDINFSPADYFISIVSNLATVGPTWLGDF